MVTLDTLLSRQSVGVLAEPGPTPGELDALLQAATTVPDHGRLRPWRLVVIEGEARRFFGEALADAGRQADPEITDEALDRLRRKAFVAPTMIAVAARLQRDSKIPQWEQVASASCAGYAIALAAHSIGLGAMWKSTNFTTGAALRAVLDLAPTDRFLGWINLGRLPDGRQMTNRPSADLAAIARTLHPDGTVATWTSS